VVAGRPRVGALPARDAARQSGMQKGVTEGYAKMDAVLERLSNRS
jgi:hypothetical protein